MSSFTAECPHQEIHMFLHFGGAPCTEIQMKWLTCGTSQVKKNTLLRVIPTMAFNSFHLTIYLAYLSGISIWHSIWHVFWHFIWHIFWHSTWHIFWHSIWHFYMTFYLAYLLTLYLAYLLTFCLAYLLTFYLAYLLTFYLAFYMTFYLA